MRPVLRVMIPGVVPVSGYLTPPVSRSRGPPGRFRGPS